MTLSVCLTLDPFAERAVRAVWQRLEEDGISTLLSHTHGLHIPHLTLASLRSWDLTSVQRELSGTPVDLPHVVHFDALGMFRRSRCWLVPAASRPLLHDQQAVVDAVRCSGADLHRHYEPGRWVPHLTLAPRLHLKDLPVVAARVYDVLPLSATLTEVTLIDTSTGARHSVV